MSLVCTSASKGFKFETEEFIRGYVTGWCSNPANNQSESDEDEAAQAESKRRGRPPNRSRSATKYSEFDYRRGRTERNNC